MSMGRHRLRVFEGERRAYDAAYAELEALLLSHGPLLPDDRTILESILGSSLSVDWERTVSRELSAGRLRRVFIGAEAHLTRIARDARAGSPPLDPDRQIPNGTATDVAFGERVEVDVLRERLVLYRSLLVGGFLGAALLLREALLLFL